MSTDSRHFNDRNPVNDRYTPPECGEPDALTALLADGRLSGGADVVSEYESAAATWFGTRHAIAVNSGSSALHAALTVSGVGAGDEVIVPATAPLPTALPVLTCQAVPVIVDTRPYGLGIDPDDLAGKITARTKAAITLPLWGYPSDDTAACDILTNAGIPIIEDACQAHGTRYQNRYAGTVGSIGCLSTHDRKPLSTGEGGLLFTDDDDLAQRLDDYTHLGHLRGQRHGVNYKLAAPLATLGLRRLTGLTTQLAARRDNATRLLATLDASDDLHELRYRPGDAPNYYNLVIVAKRRHDRLAHYLATAGLPPDTIRYGYRPLYHHPVFARYGSTCPAAEDLCAAALQLPVHPGLTAVETTWIQSRLARLSAMIND